MQHDDRDEFEAHKSRQCRALGNDEATFEQTVETVVALDRFDYPYLWSWLGLPIIQLPADIIVTQEVIWANKPDIIIETGVARGGSVVFLASMMQLIGRGRVIGVDIEIRPHNRAAIENHPLSHRISLIEGSSTALEILDKVRAEIPDGASVMVILDSDHSRDHVLKELQSYAPLVTTGQFLVVADTLLGRMRPDQTPKKRAAVWESGNEPLAAVEAYLSMTDRFKVDREINGKLVISSSPGGYLKCVR